MLRREVFILLIFASLLGSCEQKGEHYDLPNIVLILVDDMGYGDVGFNGNKVVQTIELDKLAEQSVKFDRFYVSPVCAPTRASLLTGRYHLMTGVSWVTHRKEVMRKDEYTIAEFLKTKGYTTGLFGKWHNGKQYPHDPIGQGFDTFLGFSEGHINNYFNTSLISNFTEIESKGFLPDVLTNAAMDFITGQEPFFAMLSYNTPHSPFQIPQDLFEKYKSKGLDDQLSTIYGMIDNIDYNIGKLVNHIENLGLGENTLIIFLSDNGPNTARFNNGLKGIKSHVDEGGVRVPFFIKYPKRGWTNKTVQESFGAHIDIFPTLVEVLDSAFELPRKHHGKSLVPVIESENPSKDNNRYLFTHQVVREFDRVPGAVRKGDFLMTFKPNKTELYNLKIDPTQSTDLVDSLRGVAADLGYAYKSWIEVAEKNLGSNELIETGHPDVHNVVFPAPEADSIINASFQGGIGWANDFFINLENDSRFVWNTKTISNSEYEVICKLQAGSGSELHIEIGQSKNKWIAETDIAKRLIESPDRVRRNEVYEYEWGEVSLGNVQLSNGINSLIITSQNPENLEIKEIILKSIRE